MHREVLVVVGLGGMGEDIVRRLGPGRTVLAGDRDEEALAERVARLEQEGYEVKASTVDVSSLSSVASMADAAASLGPVTNVVHTAGVSPAQASVEAILKVDLLGTALVLEEFGRIVADGGAGVVISSMAGQMAIPLDAAQDLELSTCPSEDLLALPISNSDGIGDPGTAYGFAKRGQPAQGSGGERALGSTRGAHQQCESRYRFDSNGPPGVVICRWRHYALYDQGLSDGPTRNPQRYC